jgi:hypothetical protein
MPLNNSGQLALGGSTVGESVNLELGKAATAQVGMNDTDLRTLFGVSTGQISMSNGYGKSTGPSIGLVDQTANQQYFTFSTETIATISGSIASSPGLNSGFANSGTRSYYTVGTAYNFHNYANQTNGTTAAAPAENRSQSGQMNSQTRGYWGGGSTSPRNDIGFTIDGLVFSSETQIGIIGSLVQGRSQTCGVSSPSEAGTGRGYFGGGGTEPSTVLTGQVDGLIFASQSVIDPAAGLVQARRLCSGYQSSVRGYWAGGSGFDQIDGIQFSTETTVDPGAVLVQARQAPGSGTNSLTRGYTFGGPALNQIDGMQFNTESQIDPGAGIAVASFATAGCNFAGL